MPQDPDSPRPTDKVVELKPPRSTGGRSFPAQHSPLTFADGIARPLLIGHGFARPENRLSFFAVAEAFLAEHLGGRYEPIGDDLDVSSISVPVGVDQIAGLREAPPPK